MIMILIFLLCNLNAVTSCGETSVQYAKKDAYYPGSDFDVFSLFNSAVFNEDSNEELNQRSFIDADDYRFMDYNDNVNSTDMENNNDADYFQIQSYPNTHYLRGNSNAEAENTDYSISVLSIFGYFPTTSSFPQTPTTSWIMIFEAFNFGDTATKYNWDSAVDDDKNEYPSDLIENNLPKTFIDDDLKENTDDSFTNVNADLEGFDDTTMSGSVDYSQYYAEDEDKHVIKQFFHDKRLELLKTMPENSDQVISKVKESDENLIYPIYSGDFDFNDVFDGVVDDLLVGVDDVSLGQVEDDQEFMRTENFFNDATNDRQDSLSLRHYKSKNVSIYLKDIEEAMIQPCFSMLSNLKSFIRPAYDLLFLH